MKSAAVPAMALSLLLVVGGCASHKTEAPKASAALDVSPAPAMQAPAPVLTPAVSEAPAPVTPAMGGGQTYVVKKGDYLFKIVRDHYNGDLSQVKKVKAANPGINYDQLKPGDKLILP